MTDFIIMDRLEPIARLFVSEGFITLYVAGVVLFALYVYSHRFWWKLRRVKSALALATEAICRADSRAAFHDRFEEISQKLSQDQILGGAWRVYLPFLFPRRDRESPVIGATRAPSEILTWDGLLEGQIDYRQYDEIPNYLVGIGILGTFLGLTGGMILASGQLSGTEEQLRVAVSDLIHGASLAFLSSVAGLGSSLGFSVSTKRNLRGLRHTLDVLLTNLAERIEFVRAEHVATEQLRESRKQTDQLQQFNTELAIQISAALDEKLSQRFAPTLKEMIGVLEQVRDERSESTERMLKEIVDHFRQTMTGAAGSEMTALSDTLNQLTTVVQETTQGLSGATNEAGAGLVEASKAAAEEIRQVVVEATRRFDEGRAATDQAVDETLTRMEAQVERLAGAMSETATGAGQKLLGAAEEAGSAMQDAATRVGETLLTGAGELEEQLRAFGGSVDLLKKSLDDAERLADQSRAAYAQLEETVQSIATATAALRSASLPVAEVARSLIEQLEEHKHLRDALEKSAAGMNQSAESVELAGKRQAEAWQDIQARFEDLDQSLKGAFTELTGGVDAYSEKIREFVKSLDQSMSQATSLLSGAVKELGDTIDEWGEKT